jgi:hypothetical protein
MPPLIPQASTTTNGNDQYTATLRAEKTRAASQAWLEAATISGMIADKPDTQRANRSQVRSESCAFKR